jgi:hypothetical protein
MTGVSEHHEQAQLSYERPWRKQSSGMPKNKIGLVSLPSSLGSSSKVTGSQVVPWLSASSILALELGHHRRCWQVSKAPSVDIASVDIASTSQMSTS